MKKLNRLNLILVLLINLFSCNNDTSLINRKLSTEQMQDSILTIYRATNGLNFSFYPEDKLLEIGNKIDMRVYKDGYLTSDSLPYYGKVNINIGFIQNEKKLKLEMLNTNRTAYVDELRGILKLNITDEKGEKLKLNPKHYPIILFPPVSYMISANWYIFDSLSNSYKNYLYSYEKCREFGKLNNDSLINEFEINIDLIDNSTTKNSKKINYKGANLTKKEIVGYELTLKDNGYYYIGARNRNQNTQVCDINFNVTIEGQKNQSVKNVILLIYTEDEDLNYILNASFIGNNKFKIIPNSLTPLVLPLNYHYTIFGYYIYNEKCYQFIKKNVVLRSTNNFDIKLKNVEFNELLKTIDNL